MDILAAKPIKILIVEDYEITRIGIKLALDKVPDLAVVGEAEDGQTAVNQALEILPDVVIMDIGLPSMDGIEATSRIKAELPLTRVIILSSHQSDNDVFAALAAGADGYCLKDVGSAQLVSAIRAVFEGVAWLDAGIARKVLKACGRSAPLPVIDNAVAATVRHEFPLSQRELDVLLLVVEGKTNQEIASKLILSVETVKTHMRHIMEKLAVSDRTQAAVKAMRQGIV